MSLLLHATATRHAPLQADALALLSALADPERGPPAPLPRAAAKRLAAALEGVLPDCAEARGGSAGELALSLELHAAYCAACR